MKFNNLLWITALCSFCIGWLSRRVVETSWHIDQETRVITDTFSENYKRHFRNEHSPQNKEIKVSCRGNTSTSAYMQINSRHTHITRIKSEYMRRGWKTSKKLSPTSHMVGPFLFKDKCNLRDDHICSLVTSKKFKGRSTSSDASCARISNTGLGLEWPDGIMRPKEIMHEYFKGVDYLYETYVLYKNDDRKKFLERIGCEDTDSAENTWIIKPLKSSQGRGMVILSNSTLLRHVALKSNENDPCASSNDGMFHSTLENLDDAKVNALAQKYEHRPLLLKGRKFHFRSYLLIACDDPLLVLYYGSMIFISAQTYDHDAKEKQSHISNTSIQKNNKSVNWDEIYWDMDQFQNYINEAGLKKHGVEDMSTYVDRVLIPEIGRIFTDVFDKAYPYMEATHDNMFMRHRMLGPDLMLDEDFNLKLIEINTHCAFGSQGLQRKEDYQKSFISDTITIVDKVFEKWLRNEHFKNIDFGRWRVLIDNSRR